MTEPEEEREKTPKTDAILRPPTANPTRTKTRPEDGDERARNDAERRVREDEDRTAGGQER